MQLQASEPVTQAHGITCTMGPKLHTYLAMLLVIYSRHKPSYFPIIITVIACMHACMHVHVEIYIYGIETSL